VGPRALSNVRGVGLEGVTALNNLTEEKCLVGAWLESLNGAAFFWWVSNHSFLRNLAINQLGGGKRGKNRDTCHVREEGEKRARMKKCRRGKRSVPRARASLGKPGKSPVELAS